MSPIQITIVENVTENSPISQKFAIFSAFSIFSTEKIGVFRRIRQFFLKHSKTKKIAMEVLKTRIVYKNLTSFVHKTFEASNHKW